MNKYLLTLFSMFNLTMYIDGGEGGGSDGGNGDEGSEGGEGIEGGEQLLAGRFKSQDELIKGYTELEAAFSGKDEAHNKVLSEFKSPEEYAPGEGWDSENPMNNRMMAVLQEVGKEYNMPQGMYESIFNGITEMQERVQTETLEETQKSIPNYETRANAMADTALKYLRPDQAKAIDKLMQSKESFEAMELIMAKMRGASIPGVVQTDDAISDDELRSKIRNLNPADTRERERLLKIINSRSDGEGSLV